MTNTATVALSWADPKDDNRECCMNCGRVLKDGSGYMVVVVEGGAAVLDPKDWDRDDIVTDPGYMGVWDLGPECAKAIPANYRVKRS